MFFLLSSKILIINHVQKSFTVDNPRVFYNPVKVHAFLQISCLVIYIFILSLPSFQQLFNIKYLSYRLKFLHMKLVYLLGLKYLLTMISINGSKMFLNFNLKKIHNNQNIFTEWLLHTFTNYYIQKVSKKQLIDWFTRVKQNLTLSAGLFSPSFFTLSCEDLAIIIARRKTRWCFGLLLNRNSFCAWNFGWLHILYMKLKDTYKEIFRLVYY